MSKLEGLKDLEHFHYLIARGRIRSSLRRIFNIIKNGKTLKFSLNRQAAFAGYISLYHDKESVLGPILVTVKGDINGFIEHVCR